MNRIEGKEFVFTGRIRIPRHNAWDLVEKYSGLYNPGLRGSTDFVVIGEDPGEKAELAHLMNKDILTEQEFFDMIDEAAAEAAPTPEPVPEEPEIPVPIEEWIKGATCFVCQDCGNAYAVHLEKDEEPKCPLCSNLLDNSDYSFNNPTTLSKLLSEHPEIKLAPPMQCLVCEAVIPYSIHKGPPLRYYCFKCRRYLTRVDKEVNFEDKNGNLFHYTPGWIIGLVKDPSDLYTLTKKLLLGGLNWEPYEPPSEVGQLLTNELGKISFFSFEDLFNSEELVKIRDRCNSLEFYIDVLQDTQAYAAKLQKMPAYILPEISDTQKEELIQRFAQQYDKKATRREESHQRRFDKRRARHLESINRVIKGSEPDETESETSKDGAVDRLE